MVQSMTGYGQAFTETDDYKISVEMKSVNHRFLDVSLRMPREYLAAEELIKKKVGEFMKRGRVDLFINLERKGGPKKVLKVNWDLLEQYIGAYNTLNERFSVQNQVKLGDLLAMPEVVELEEPGNFSQDFVNPLLNTVESACHQLVHMRKLEGKTLTEDLSLRLAKLDKLVLEIKARAPNVVRNYRERLSQRMAEFITGEIEETRILTEAALFADRANIDEELVRMASHCGQFMGILQLTEPVGRKLDFLVQEMNREINTIGAKANDVEISQRVVEIKAELEKIREQIQNIE
ncbi:YicC/YloC family endoribonuclease [Ammoniphilus resinae]|uniref:Uncharacterized protein (TIGR00255 family) n=1 Tax=Ammoniphilus resinae TaxID=861532 RepID=A0ABS4GLC2_9BACL|nr:YicC/YloC family endoribonuclease [Ammoniphilus resinae]MBP1930715.1 uncharacterized protein (TIGR00255 family) [Ammoniphilus resinae]